MKPYILPTLLIIAEIIFFIYIFARNKNRDFRIYMQNIREKILQKTRLNINTEIRDFSKKEYIIFFIIFIFTFFLDDKMVIVILITIFMIFLLRLRISYEKFEEIFENYNPSIRKYNIYLSILLLIQILTITLTILYAG